MWYCTAVGLEDPARLRVDAGDAARRDDARAEAAAIVTAFRAAAAGDETHLVPAAQIAERLDVKSCLLRPGRKVEAWRRRGLAVEPLGTWVTQRTTTVDVPGDQIVRLLSVRYDGHADRAVSCVRASIKYGELRVARAGDLVVSHINAIHGGICVLPPELDGVAVSPEYTILAPRPGVSAHALWAILRSPEVRAELLTRASGLGRHRIDAELLLALPVPAPPPPLADSVDQAIRHALGLEAEAAALRARAQASIEAELDLRSEGAERIIAAFKPPR
jgi:type I restriction enzyme M protein